MLDVSKLLEEIKKSPYEELDILAPHCGVITFAQLAVGDQVFDQAPDTTPRSKGTLLATIERERNKKPLYATQKASVAEIAEHLEGGFVEAGTLIMRLKHYLSRQEVLDLVLKQTLILFRAPERARYYFTSEVDKKIATSGLNEVAVHDGRELFIMSRMKRETLLKYSGPEGNIYSAYFKPGDTVDAGEPLIGVCPPEQLALIQDVVFRVENEWPDQSSALEQ